MRSDWSELRCPIARALDVLGDPWILLILKESLTGQRRFDGFREGLGIAESVLASRLKKMVESGLMIRIPYRDDGKRLRNEYAPTPSAVEAWPILQAYARWAQSNAPFGRAVEDRGSFCHGGATGDAADGCWFCGSEQQPQP